MAVNRKLIITSFFAIIMMTIRITTSAPFTKERCEVACSRSIVDEEMKSCRICVKDYPINFQNCEYACVRDIEPICKICGDNYHKFVSRKTCIYACETLNSPWMKMICIGCHDLFSDPL